MPFSIRSYLHAPFTVALLSAALLPGGAIAADATVRHYDIPALPLSSALNQLGQQAQLLLSFPEDLTSGQTSHPIKGDYTVDVALQTLLVGTQVIAVRQADGRYTFLPAADSSAVQLPVTSITGMTLGLTTENTGSYTTGAVSIGRDNRSIKETPQSVSVMTKQRMEDQSLQSLTDVMNQTTGVTLYQGTNLHSQYLSRGFAISSTRVDGGTAVMNAGSGAGGIDMAIYDHVEVLRGVDGLYAGAGEPGGTINLVRKKPTSELQTKIMLQSGS